MPYLLSPRSGHDGHDVVVLTGRTRTVFSGGVRGQLTPFEQFFSPEKGGKKAPPPRKFVRHKNVCRRRNVVVDVTLSK